MEILTFSADADISGQCLQFLKLFWVHHENWVELGGKINSTNFKHEFVRNCSKKT